VRHSSFLLALPPIPANQQTTNWPKQCRNVDEPMKEPKRWFTAVWALGICFVFIIIRLFIHIHNDYDNNNTTMRPNVPATTIALDDDGWGSNETRCVSTFAPPTQFVSLYVFFLLY
jgi:hypothetical protein